MLFKTKYENYTSCKPHAIKYQMLERKNSTPAYLHVAQSLLTLVRGEHNSPQAPPPLLSTLQQY